MKALREAKRNTTWQHPTRPGSRTVLDVLAAGCSRPRDFMADFEPFVARVAAAGERSALGQLLLKLTCPGVPDIYQGDELWSSRSSTPTTAARSTGTRAADCSSACSPGPPGAPVAEAAPDPPRPAPCAGAGRALSRAPTIPSPPSPVVRLHARAAGTRARRGRPAERRSSSSSAFSIGSVRALARRAQRARAPSRAGPLARGAARPRWTGPARAPLATAAGARLAAPGASARRGKGRCGGPAAVARKRNRRRVGLLQTAMVRPHGSVGAHARSRPGERAPLPSRRRTPWMRPPRTLRERVTMPHARCLVALVAPLLAIAPLPASATPAAVQWPQSGLPLYANPLLEQSPTETSEPRPEEAAPPTTAVVSWYAARFHLQKLLRGLAWRSRIVACA